MDNSSNKINKRPKSQKELVPKTPEMYNLYTSHFKSILENINYYISKKNPYYSEISEKCQIYLKKLTVDYDLNGDKYIPIIIKSLYIENYKLAKYVLPDLSQLIKNNFILGRNDIMKFRTDLTSFIVKEIRNFTNENIGNKKIIDLLIIILTKLDEIYQDDDIWIYLSECLSEIIHNINMINNIFGESFKKIYEFYFRLYIKFEEEEKHQKKIKSELIYFINYQYNLFSKFYNSDIINLSYTNYLKQIYHNLSSQDCIENSKNKNYNPIDLYICRTVKNIVDIICYRFEGQNNKSTENKIIPLIPKKESDFKKLIFRYLENPKIFNENSLQSGFFGWCYICRRPASYYCIKFYLPICSFQCKHLIQKEEDDLNKFSFSLVKDCAKLFEFFCKILIEKKYFSHQKNMIFNLIDEMLIKFGKIFKHSILFQKVVKYYLIEGLIKTSLSKDEKIFIPSIKMFFKIWKFFKKSIKNEIYSYIENALMKIMNSSNASFLHKKTVLENLMNQEFFYFLELYINFDYDLNEKFIIYNLISIFSDIIKGRFYKNSKNNNSFTEHENNELINYSLKILSLILQSIFDLASKIFPEKNNLNKTEQDKNNNTNLLYTFSSENKKNFLTVNSVISEKENLGGEFNNISIHNILKTTDLNLTDTLNKNYNSAITDKNFPDSPESINRQTINEDTIKELLSTQRIRNTNSNLSMNNYDVRKNLDYEIAVKKFNKKYEYGLAYLKTLGYININSIDDEAKDINNFLKEAENINKINLFEFFGENTELSTKTLEFFLENFNFCGLGIGHAVKIFFWIALPPYWGGEKFEKILTFFSAKYYKDNKFNDDFSLLNEENIFCISYSIIILSYSQKKFDLNEFIDLVNNLLINNAQKLLDEEFLKNIYNDMKKVFNANINNFKLNKDIDINIIKKIKFDFNNKDIKYQENKYKTIHKEDMSEYLYQLTLSIWKKLSVTCNIIIEESNDENIYKKGIYGIVYIIKILGLMELEQQKQTVISLICFMSNLLQIKTIKEKNIFCIKQILFLANGDFRFCKGGWESILKIINKLHFYYLLDTMPKYEKDEIINKLKNYNIERENLDKLSKIFTPNNYEKIFNKTYGFDFETLIEFVQSLCEIARKEFIENGLTKTFFLEKIVETAENNIFLNKKDFNINQIWKILSHFFVKVGSLNNTENAITCIDSLRQLVSKFLTKKECIINRFQSELFKPFLQIINITKNLESKEYIYSCINTLITTHIENIKYGWITVINIYKELYYINELSNMKSQVLDIFITISEKNFKEVIGVINNFLSFLKLYIPSYPEKTMKIINILFKNINNENNYKSLLKLYLYFFINESEEIRNKSLINFNYNISKEYIAHYIFLKDIYKKENFWKLIFQEILYKSMDYLSQKISEFSSNNTISILNAISNNNNLNLSLSDSLTDISSHKSLNVKGARNNNNEKIKYSNSLNNLLVNTINILNNFFQFNYKEFKNFLNFLEKIIFFDDEKVQKIGIQIIKILFESDKIKNNIFLLNFIKFFISVLNKSSGSELNKINLDELKNNAQSKIILHHLEKNIFLSHIHYNVLFLLDKTLPKITKHIKLDDINKIIDMFFSSYSNAITFNEKINLRLTISNLMKITSTINLFQQFQISIKNYFFLLEYICNKNNKNDSYKIYQEKIFSSAEEILKGFINIENEYKNLLDKNNDNSDEIIDKEIKEKEIIMKYYNEPLCGHIFPGIKKAKFYENDKYRNIFCQIFLEMISCENIKIRENIKDLLNISFDILYKDN